MFALNVIRNAVVAMLHRAHPIRKNSAETKRWDYLATTSSLYPLGMTMVGNHLAITFSLVNTLIKTDVE